MDAKDKALAKFWSFPFRYAVDMKRIRDEVAEEKGRNDVDIKIVKPSPGYVRLGDEETGYYLDFKTYGASGSRKDIVIACGPEVAYSDEETVGSFSVCRQAILDLAEAIKRGDI